MKIDELVVRVAGRQETLRGHALENPDVALLLKRAKQMTVKVFLDVPPTTEVGGALGRLLFARVQAEEPKARAERRTPVEQELTEEELINNLSKKLGDLGLSARPRNALRDAGVAYAWEIAKMQESHILKTKNFGRKSLNEVRHVLDDLGLHLGMNLEKYQSRLPPPLHGRH